MPHDNQTKTGAHAETVAVTINPCPLCDSLDVEDLTRFSKDKWTIRQCRSCSFVFLANPVDYQGLEDSFAWEKTFYSEDDERESKRGPIKRLARQARILGYKLRSDPHRRYLRILGSGKILDIGCGDVVRWRPPFVPWGIEISKVLAARADALMKPLGGACLQGAGAKAIFEIPENSFDSVMMHSYLEHEKDFLKLLHGTFRVLKLGGRAFVRVPNFASLNRRYAGAKWPGFRFPDHVNYFTPRTLEQAAQVAGLRFRLVNRHKIWLDDNIQAVLEKPSDQ